MNVIDYYHLKTSNVTTQNNMDMEHIGSHEFADILRTIVTPVYNITNREAFSHTEIGRKRGKGVQDVLAIEINYKRDTVRYYKYN